jgi:ubiquinone/menaquinone biosynthesis C-methylase UbiE
MKNNIQDLVEQLKALAKREFDGIWHCSEDTAYAFDEGKYDERMKRNVDAAKIAAMAKKKAGLFSSLQLPEPVVAIEIGCGTGVKTSAVLYGVKPDFMIISDKSHKFCSLARDRIEWFFKEMGAEKPLMLNMVLSADDLDILPDDYFSIFFLHAVLHHINDWGKALETMERKLKAGGVIFIAEPCFEVSLILSSMFGVILSLDEGVLNLTSEEKRKLNAYHKAILFRLTTGLDKSDIEEKHTFRIDDILLKSQELGMECRVFPDAMPLGLARPEGCLYDTVMQMLHGPAGFSDSLMEKIEPLISRTITGLEPAWASGHGPYRYAQYILRKGGL